METPTQAPTLLERCDRLSADIKALHEASANLLERVKDFCRRAEAEIARARRAA